jgi:hypothetical protein
MNILDEYRRNARECQRMADNAGNSDDRASWLRLAASWLSMLKNETQRILGNGKHQESDKEPLNSLWPRAPNKDLRASH